MIAQRDYRDFLADIVGACRSLIRFVERMTLEAYLADERTRYAVMRAYEIMGEAVGHLPQELKTANPDIPWATMAAVRNRIAHAYFGIDDTILFATINEELTELLPLRLAVCVPAPVTGLPGSASGTCFAGPHSPWSPPFAPPAPLRLAPPQIAPQGAVPLCSPASQLL